MNILYIAYSCDPYNGSEDKIGWNVPFESSRYNEVFVITKEEHKETIEAYLKENPNRHLHFYFVDISTTYKKIFKGFFYSGRLNRWHTRALPFAKMICNNNYIDIIHQINPIEFRAIGEYGKINGIKFVVGPLGGGEYMPKGLKDYAKGHKNTENIRQIANILCKIRYRINGRFKSCDYIMFANKETQNYLESMILPELYVNNDYILSEVGISECEISNSRLRSDTKKRIVFLVAGRMVYRKGYDFLLDALLQLGDTVEYECRFLGEGPELTRLKERVENIPKLKKSIVFTGMIPFSEMSKEYANADVFIMPSLRETTGSVLLEAMAYALPVIAIDKFGGANILNRKTGWLYAGNTKVEYINSLSRCIMECVNNLDEIQKRGNYAFKTVKKYTWEKKCKYYQKIYEGLLNNSDEVKS